MVYKSILSAVFMLFATVVGAQELLPRSDKRPMLIDDIRKVQPVGANENKPHKISDAPIAAITSAQNKQLQALQANMQKKLNRLNNQLVEKRAKQQVLEMQNPPNTKTINKLINKQTSILEKMLIEQAKYEQKIRAILAKK